jgi:predicted aldo/keto reductase-like oxidoreductase
MNRVDRRTFLQSTSAAAGVTAVSSPTHLPSAGGGGSETPDRPLLPTRVLGKTGFSATLLGLGGEHAFSLHNNDAAAEEIVHTALQLGVNYFDTAEQYFPSEKYLGNALQGNRERVYISTKIDSRDPEAAKPLIERSLTLLRTSYLDNLSVHRVRNSEDVDRLTKKGGLIELMLKLKQQGVVRNIGITGHYEAAALLEMMKRIELDTVLLPVNAADDHFQSFRAVRQEAKRQNMGVIAMKVSGRGRLFRECGFTEMDPLLTYALSQEDVHLAIVGIENVSQLRDNVRIVRGFSPMSVSEQQLLQQRVLPHAEIASFYKPGASGWLD